MGSRFEHARELTHFTRSVVSGSVTLHVESLEADAAEHTIVLLSEAEAPSSRWPTDFVVGITRSFGRCVWFDTRDIGASTWLDDPYSMRDLVADVEAVIDELDLGVVDLLGRSMGGEVAMRLALSRPELVNSLILLSTTPGRREELGLPEQWLIEKMSDRLLAGAPSSDEDRANWIVDQLEWFNGPVFAFDRAAALVHARAEVRSGWRGPNGHGLAVMEAEDVVERIRGLRVPTSIIHGTADPVLPVDHARALHALIEDSTLTLVEGLGHELPEAFIEQLIQLIGSVR